MNRIGIVAAGALAGWAAMRVLDRGKRYDFRDRTVLVTGGSRGLGLVLARQLAAEGARVAICGRDPEALERARAALEAIGAEVYALPVDVADRDAVATLIAKVTGRFGPIDVLVNNAGVTRRAYIMDLTEQDWDRIHRVNAKGVFFCLQRAAHQMIQQGGGRIINIASIAGRGYAGTSNAAYAASKGAVIALTKTAAQQLGPHNINVNAICPGVTITPLGERNLVVRAQEQGVSLEEALENHIKPIPLGRANEPEDIAALAVFLASPGARNITGQAYNIDGGLVPS